jgi:hypothetical protein
MTTQGSRPFCLKPTWRALWRRKTRSLPAGSFVR